MTTYDQGPQGWRELAQGIEAANVAGHRVRGQVIGRPVGDHGRLKLHAPHPVYDLPAGGRRLQQKADGYCATIVNGQVTYRNGEPTGLPTAYARPGLPAAASRGARVLSCESRQTRR
ncbi:MAG TPA: hypothetical protein VLK85_27520 [Ramlibacter sp.]|nr:hypothetical protein [Ramlibacter sp.]